MPRRNRSIQKAISFTHSNSREFKFCRNKHSRIKNKSQWQCIPWSYSQGNKSLNFLTETINIVSKAILKQEKQFKKTARGWDQSHANQIAQNNPWESIALKKEFKELSNRLSHLNQTTINWEHLKAYNRKKLYLYYYSIFQQIRSYDLMHKLNY